MRHRRFFRALVISLPLGMAPALAIGGNISPSDCTVEMDHAVEMAPKKIGGGFVATPSVGFDAFSEKRAFEKTLYVFDCRSYTEIPIEISTIADVPLNKIDALMAKEKQKPIELVTSLQKVGDDLTLAKVRQVAGKFGFSTYVNRMAMENTIEVCGCHVFYPELRGGRDIYRGSE